MLSKHRNPDGTHDGFGIIAELARIPRKSVFQIAAEVKANQARLNGCMHHAFTPILPIKVVSQRYRCAKCAGEVDFHAWYWHEKGRRAA